MLLESLTTTGGVASSTSRVRTKRVTLTDGLSMPLNGMCVFILRNSTTKAIATSSMTDVSQRIGSVNFQQ